MQENKNLVQEALLQMKNVEEAIAENAKGILASTMKEEINQLVKESLSEQEDEDEVEMDTEMDQPSADDVEMDLDMDVDNSDDDMETDMELDMDIADDTPIDLTNASDEEILKVFKAMSEEDGIIVTKDGEDIHLTDNEADSEYIVKLGESEEESDLDKIVADIFSETSEETHEETYEETDEETDEEVDEVMYEITLDEESDEEMTESDDDEDEDSEDEESDEEMTESDDEVYEETDEEWNESMDESYDHKKAIKPKGVGIGKGPKFSYKSTGKGGFKEDMKQGNPKMGTGKPKFDYDKKGANLAGKSKKVETKEGQGYDDKEDEKLSMKHGKIASKDLKSTKARRDDAGFEKRETKEAARTYGMGSKEGRGLRKGITNNRNYNYSNSGVKVESLEAEVSMLREKNEEYRKALNVFREKLNEVAIFNSNLAYATRLFTEHSTTKKEKINILRRFDSVETLKESKGLYKVIKDELSNGETKSITESVENKLNTNVSSGSAINLIESKTYENPQFLRMRDLMSKIK